MAVGQTSAGGGGGGEFVNGSLDGRTLAYYEGENGCVYYQGDGATTPTVKVRKGSLFYTAKTNEVSGGLKQVNSRSTLFYEVTGDFETIGSGPWA